MIILNNEKKNDVMLITPEEKKKMKDELTNVYNAGGRELHVSTSSNRITVFNSKGKIIAYIIGETAVLLAAILIGINTKIYSTTILNIKEIIHKYCN